MHHDYHGDSAIMTDEINRSLGRIEGTLTEFKAHTDRRFDELKDVISLAHKRAEVAEEKAEKAQSYAEGIVRKATYYSMGFAGAITTVLFFIKNKAIASIFGVH